MPIIHSGTVLTPAIHCKWKKWHMMVSPETSCVNHHAHETTTQTAPLSSLQTSKYCSHEAWTKPAFPPRLINNPQAPTPTISFSGRAIRPTIFRDKLGCILIFTSGCVLVRGNSEMFIVVSSHFFSAGGDCGCTVSRGTHLLL
jgi:hypothetical protein